MDRVAERAIRRAGCTEQFRHWGIVWMAMPEVSYRLAYCLGEVRLADTGATLIERSFAAAAITMDGWISSTSTLQLVRDAVRAMLTVALELAEYQVMLDTKPWDPLSDGPLAEAEARQPLATVSCRRDPANRENRLDILHALLAKHVFGDVCGITLRMSYRQLMGLKENA